MSSWKDTLLDYIREDYQICRLNNESANGKAQKSESCLVGYLREKKESAPAVRVKRAFKGNDNEVWETLLAVLADVKQVGAYESLDDLSCKPEEAESKRDANRRVAEWVSRTAPFEVAPDRAKLRAIGAEIVRKTGSKSNLCEQLMGYQADRYAGKDALCTAEEQNRILVDIRKRGSRKLGGLLDEKTPKAPDIDKAIDALLDAEARDWLYNAGVPFSSAAKPETSDASLPSRIKDIPTDLVEKCLHANGQLAERLGISCPETERREGAQGQARAQREAHDANNDGPASEAEDIETLYRSLLGNEDPYLIPLRIDQETGLELCLIGPGFVPDRSATSKDERLRGLLASLFSGKLESVRTKPFFALLGKSIDPAHARIQPSAQEYVDADGDEVSINQGVTIHGLWDHVAKAYIPNVSWSEGNGSIGNQALRLFAELRRCSDRSDLQMYQEFNGDWPKGCPQRYLKYFSHPFFA